MEEHSIVESVLDNLPVAVFAKDASDDFRFVLWNKKQEEVTTLRTAKAIGRNDYDLFSEESADYFRSVDKAVIKRGKLMKVPEEIIETRNGREVHLRTVKIPVHDKETGRLLVMGISEDLTGQVKSREQLEQLNRHLVATNKEFQETWMQRIPAEKLESIGRLAAGVAHEVKTPSPSSSSEWTTFPRASIPMIRMSPLSSTRCAGRLIAPIASCGASSIFPRSVPSRARRPICASSLTKFSSSSNTS